MTAHFAARGHELWLPARDAPRARALRARFPRSRTLVADLAAPDGLRGRLEAQELPPRLDSLLHVAGVAESGRVEEVGAEVWQHTLAVNLVAPAELTRLLLLPALRAARGHVVFMNSGAGVHAPPRLGAYAASKFGLKALAETLRAEEHEHGVRVTTVYPGETDTPMQARLHEQFGLPYEPEAHMSGFGGGRRRHGARAAQGRDHERSDAASGLLSRPPSAPRPPSPCPLSWGPSSPGPEAPVFQIPTRSA